MKSRSLRLFMVLLGSYTLMGATLSEPLVSSLLQIASLTIGLIIFLVLSAFYAGSETALVSVDKVRIDRLAEERKPARIIKNLIETPEKMLGLTLVGTNLANVIASQAGLLLVIALLKISDPILHVVEILHINEEAVATLITTGLILVFGELLPKTIFRVKAEPLALRYAYPLWISEHILGPIVGALTYLTRLLIGMDKSAAISSREAHRDELRLLATMGEQSGGLLREQRRMIHSVLDLHVRTVEQVMVPLVDIVAVEKETDIESFLQAASESSFSRIPVYEGQIYNIIGIVHLLDVIYANGNAKTIEPFIRTDIQFVPESKNISVLLKEIQRSRHTMVFVVDEYGGIVGLATVEDLVEEIVGEISEERDETLSIRVISPRILECDGRTEIDVLSDRFGIQIPSGDYETVAGYILEQTGTIPKPGDGIETDAFVITVSDADARSIRRIRIRNKHRNLTQRRA